MKTPYTFDHTRRPRLKKQTLRRLGTAELERVQGAGGDSERGFNGNSGHPKPIATRYCVG